MNIIGVLVIFQPFVDLADTTGTRALVDPVISLVQPVTKVLINLGYDRETNPGIPRTLSILPANPFQNWFTVGEDLAGGAVEGVTNVVDGVDVTKPPTTPPADPLVAADTSSSNVTNLVSQQTTTVVDDEPITPVAKVNDTPVKNTVTKLNDVTDNKPVATAVKKAAASVQAAADKVGAQVKATVDKVKDNVTAAAKATKNDTTPSEHKDAA